MPPSVVAFDLGQSGSRLLRADGTVSTSTIGLVPGRTIADTIDHIFAELNPGRADIAALSLTGLHGCVQVIDEIAVVCQVHCDSNAVVVADDGLAGFFGAIGSQAGLVMSIGSGISSVAFNGESVAHKDGLGWILGDDGSGFWIGRAGLRAGLRNLEGRGPDTHLTAKLTEIFGALHEVANTYTMAQIHDVCVRAGRIVIEQAELGDAVAVCIVSTAADRLLATAEATWREIERSLEPPVVSLMGGLCENDFFTALLSTKMLAKWPKSLLVPPESDHLVGVRRIAESMKSDLLPLMKWWRS